MKHKNLLIILIGVLVVCMIGMSLFYVFQGVMDAQREQEYFDVYRAKAEEYIRSAPRMLEKYGDNMAVQFDSATRYKLSGERSFLDTVKELFGTRTPDTIEEFVTGIDWIKFTIAVNGEEYEITFSKNEQGELVVSSLTESE